MYKSITKQEAFTLVELLVTTVIIGVLATISFANFQEFREAGYRAELTIIGRSMATGAEVLKSDRVLAGDYYIEYETRSEIMANVPGIVDLPEYVGGYVRVRVEDSSSGNHAISTRMCSQKVKIDDTNVLTYRYRQIDGGDWYGLPAELLYDMQGFDFGDPFSEADCVTRSA